MKVLSTTEVKRMGADGAVKESARWLEDRSDWIACHLDADVVDPSFIPAVNYPKEGLTPGQAVELLKAFVKTEKLNVLDVAPITLSLTGETSRAGR